MSAKRFDCVEMKRKGAIAARRRLKGATLSQELAYWQTRTERLKVEQQTARARGEKALAH
jgi:hypothetical protein